MKPLLIPFVMAFNVFAIWGLFKVLFGNWKMFQRCVYYYFKPDWLSHLQGECYEDSVAEFCLFLYFGGIGLLFFGEYAFFLQH
ncbi:hypothetical protein ABS71_10280 [bacterium SCN 62-11]|mgnify:CR=1 FL=1|nr:hypothetical protein [Candidatus Eremiobacteraeota bacterium]ODT67863.1 MAG: hypothetical protein ABS71_10280 [bacterium SCN 62-11]